MLRGAQSTIGIVPMVEPAQAIFIADDMAQAHERGCGLFFEVPTGRPTSTPKAVPGEIRAHVTANARPVARLLG